MTLKKCREKIREHVISKEKKMENENSSKKSLQGKGHELKIAMETF